MNTPKDSGIPPGYSPFNDDATLVRPRGQAPVTSASPSDAPAPAAAAASAPAPALDSARADISEFLGGGMNPLVQTAGALLLLGVQLRHSVSPPDATHLRDQVIAQVRKFESHANEVGLPAQTVTAARYVLCAMLDESVLNAPWGEQSGWAQKTLLVTFHGESYGGAKFFQILERLCADFSKHIDLIELMYLCLALGFGGRYQIEAGGRTKLADIQQDLYRRIKSQRAPATDELAPHWRGIEDRRNPLIRYVPLWVIAAAAACVLLTAFVIFYARLNGASEPASAQIAQIGLDSATPPDNRSLPPVPHKSLKQLLAAQEQAGKLTVEERADGSALVRLGAADMFASGGVDVSDSQLPLMHAITAALNQVPGRVIVVGHTDDQPIHSLRFKDNFELSAARARSVVEILREGLDNPGRIESSGAGASQPVALPPSLPANRTRNRRVEIKYIAEG